MEDDAEEEQEESAGDSHHCGVCEGRGELLLCDGPCGRAFHAACMSECPDTSDTREWFCVECRDKEHECFICHQPGKDNEGTGEHVGNRRSSTKARGGRRSSFCADHSSD